MTDPAQPALTLPPLPAGHKYRFHAMVKPVGSLCNLDCTYCYYLHKQDLLHQPRQPVGAIGGLRYSKIDVSAHINASLFGLTGSAARSGDKDWVDPYVGVRIQHPLNERWTLVGYGDVGGFGAGSDFTWQVALGAAYDFSKTL